MAKQALTINDFSGGLTTDISPRDLEGNQLEICTNLDPSSKGRLKMASQFKDDDTNFTDTEAQHQDLLAQAYLHLVMIRI